MQDYFVHESSYVDDGVTIGAGTKVWHFCHIQKGAVIGRNCSLGQNVNVANNVRIGDGVRIQNNVSIYEGVVPRGRIFRCMARTRARSYARELPWEPTAPSFAAIRSAARR